MAERIYYVTLKKKEDLEGFYADMKSDGHRLNLKRPISRVTHYWLTDEAADEIRKDSRVLAVELNIEDSNVIAVPHALINYEPVGVVAALSPWNFPLVLASRKISTALAAGCSVICKPDVITPGAVMELVDICREAGVPPGVVNLLSGDPAGISEQLIKSDIVKKISVTGSTRVGKLILKQAADKVQRVTMELSGHSPFIVFDDADIKKAADMAIASKFRNNGQVCISPNRFYIQENKKDEFINLFIERTKN